MTLDNLLVNGKKPVVHLVFPEFAYIPQEVLHDAKVNVDPGHKAGGLGEYASAFTSALQDTDLFEVHAFFPASPNVINNQTPRERIELRERLAKHGYHPLEHPSFARGVYNSDNELEDYERALIFQAGLNSFIWPTTGIPSIVHAHDWPTGLLPKVATERGAKAVFTVHNHFSHLVSLRRASQIGFKGQWNSRGRRTFYFDQHPDSRGRDAHNLLARIDMLPSGIIGARFVNTVSDPYAADLVNGADYHIPASVRDAFAAQFAQGRGLSILNNVDDSVYRFDLSGKGYEPFTPETNAEGKRVNRINLKRKIGLKEGDYPIFFFPHRLAHQKGTRLVFDKIGEFSRQHGVQFAVVAKGEQEDQDIMGRIAVASDGMIGYQTYNPQLSMLGYAGSDMTISPSEYEPGGQAHRVGFRAGCFAIARNTGGLRQSIQEFDRSSGTGNGFLFDSFDGGSFWNALYRASSALRAMSPEELARHQSRIMIDDLNRTTAAMVKQYVDKMYLPCIEELNRELRSGSA